MSTQLATPPSAKKSWLGGVLDWLGGEADKGRSPRSVVRNFINRETGDRYTIKFVRGAFGGPYTMWCLSHPSCSFPLGASAHLLSGDQICVAKGEEPPTYDKARAIALAWLYGFRHTAAPGFSPTGGSGPTSRRSDPAPCCSSLGLC